MFSPAGCYSGRQARFLEIDAHSACEQSMRSPVRDTRPLVVVAVICVVYTTYYMPEFGNYIRDRREALRSNDPRFSVRQVARRIGVEPSYLSKVERQLEAPPSERKIRALAKELGEDPDFLLAIAGKVSDDLREAICHRPQLLSQLIRELKNLPDDAVLRMVREVRSGKRRKETS